MKNIGVVGKGFVGSAVAHGFSPAVGYNANVLVYDKDPLKSVDSLDDVVNKSDFIFVSVPTPSNKDGSISLDILYACISEIEDALKDNSPIVLVRSTVVPGTCEDIQNKFPKLRIVFNPEFLTERSATFDFLSQTRYILGGKDKDTSEVADLYKDRFGESIAIIETNFQTAELIKYVCNIYFATKVSFLNEMKLISDSIDADWEKVIEGFIRDGRVGSSHTNVPGHDGKLGFGGSCFPKDIQALINFAEKNNLDLNVVKGAWKTNLEVRPEKDWEKLKGRAVID
jgi:nucleotide sugar dehydrogenase|tara:strand:+ start:3243 stop:4094 length:852 start_codon:yes stop_codon:yes gene_type:complete